MDWFKMSLGLSRSLETYLLAQALDVPVAHAVGLRTQLLTWATENCADGQFGRLPLLAYQDIFSFQQDPKLLQDAFVRANILDSAGFIVGWDLGIGADIRKQHDKKEQARLRKQRERERKKAAQNLQPDPPPQPPASDPVTLLSRVSHAPVTRDITRDTSVTSRDKIREEEIREETVPPVTDQYPVTPPPPTPAHVRAREAGGGVFAKESADPGELMAAKREAAGIGLPTSATDTKRMARLLQTYGMSGVLAAIGECANASKQSRNWQYVEGTLKNMSKRGELRNGVYAKQPRQQTGAPGKPVADQNYNQRDYSEVELNALLGFG